MFTVNSEYSIILASASPRRQELLGMLDVEYALMPPLCAEPLPASHEKAADFAQRLGALKAHSVHVKSSPQKILVIIAADTIVAVAGEILGKPACAREAFAMLKKLNGRRHEVITAVCVAVGNNPAQLFAVESGVEFAQWPDNVLYAYANCGEPLDKAGAYAIQGKGAFLVKGVEGSVTNVIGLPLEELTRLLLNQGIIYPHG